MAETDPERQVSDVERIMNQGPHRPADDHEEVYFEGTPRLRGELGRMFLAILIALALIAIPILIRIFNSAWPPIWVTLGLWAAAIICIVIPILIVRSIRYRVTNYRIDYERGILSKRIDTLELWHVDDIQYHQSLTGRLLNVGTLTVLSDDKSTPRLTMHGVPNPRPVFDALKQRIISVKRQRGVIKMDMG